LKRTFRTTLLTLLIGALFGTVVVIVAVSYWNSSRSIDELRRRHYELTARAMSREVERLLSPAPAILHELQTLATRGLLPLGDPDALGEVLAERLRTQPDLGWLSFSDAASGRFVGAWKTPGREVIINSSDPQVDGGKPREVLMHRSGERHPHERNLAAGYDPRGKEWFQLASAKNGIAWSEPYVFSEGVPGITASLAARDTNGHVVGVFTADFFLDDISDFLNSIANSEQRVLVVATPAGNVLGSHPRGGGLIGGRSLFDHAPVTKAQIPTVGRMDFDFRVDGVEWDGVVTGGTPVEGLSVIAGVASPEEEFLGPVVYNARASILIGLVALAAASAIASILANRIATPLAQIAASLEKIGNFEIARGAPVATGVKEIANVADAVERMKVGLRSFAHYVPTSLVRRLLANGQEAALGGEEKELTVLFADLAGFTSLSESLTPTEIVSEMRDYFEIATEAIEHRGGTLDKFLGDGVMAIFGAPETVAGHATRACEAALDIVRSLAEMAPERVTTGHPPLRVRIGLHTGEALVGNIGTNERFAYTVFGDTANLASRLEGLAKFYGCSVLASEETRTATRERFAWRRIDRVAVVGRTRGTLLFELLGENPSKTEYPEYEAGLDAYFAGYFAAATQHFRDALVRSPTDEAAIKLLARCESLAASPPANWNGVFVANEK
jgi:adenylate cyclase